MKTWRAAANFLTFAQGIHSLCTTYPQSYGGLVMTSLDVVTIVTFLALLGSLSALVLSAGVWRAMRRTSNAALLPRLADLSEAMESHTLQIRSLRARLSALSKPRRDGKFARAEDEPDEAFDAELPRSGLTPDEWKRRMNLRLALGKGPK